MPLVNLIYFQLDVIQPLSSHARVSFERLRIDSLLSCFASPIGERDSLGNESEPLFLEEKGVDEVSDLNILFLFSSFLPSEVPEA